VDCDAVYSSTLKTEFVIFFETIIINQKEKNVGRPRYRWKNQLAQCGAERASGLIPR
jgi:hypothetical protein